MKPKILTIALVGAGLIAAFTLKPAMATESCSLQSNYQSNGYIQVKGGRHHRRGGHHRSDGYNHRSRDHHRRRNHHNAWYFIDGVLSQVSRHNHHRGERHHSNGQHHRNNY